MKKSRTILRILAALMAVMLMTMSGAPALAASLKAKINSSSAKVYNVPSTSSKIYVKGGKGLTVTVTGYSNGWARIKYKGKTGYIRANNLTLANRPKGYTKKSTPVYRQASTSSSRLGTLSMGSAVYVVGASGNFYCVQNASGSATGYVQKSSLATKAQMTAAYNKYKAYLASKAAASKKPSSTAKLSTVDKLLLYAKEYIGTSYSTYTCSEYVERVFEKYGYSMKGTAREQFTDSRYKLITNISQIKKGDILCFDTDGDANGVCDHTAIYCGDNTFLESSQKAGKVQRNTLTAYYKSVFLGARRVF